MKLRRTWAVAKKEALHIFRDPLSMALAFLMPAILMIIFGYAISLDVNNLKTIIYDLDKSSESRELVRSLESSGYFTVIKYAEDDKDISYYLDSGRAKVAVVIPEDFSKSIQKQTTAALQVIVDGSDSNTATISLGYINAVGEQYSRRLSPFFKASLIDPRLRVWYNDELKSRNFIIPGLIAVIMSIIASLLTSLTIAREWERGTMEQLISTPVKTPELILGKLFPYYAIGMIDVIFSILMAVYVFGVPLKGNIFILLGLSSLFLIGTLSWGILLSCAAKNQMVASQMAMISTYLPTFLLSGFMFAIFNMPHALQVITHIVPARYFVAILKNIFLKGSPFHYLAYDSLLLACYGGMVLFLTLKIFKKKIG